jgi:replication-associated recombination protein RarA
MQNGIEFPKSLSEKYQPAKIEDFIGLDRPKAVMANFLKSPRPSAWLFLGESGTGKTTMALVLAKQLPAELHHVPSRACDLETVEALARKCHYFPWGAKFHLVLVDEADQMTNPAQLAFLSKLDATAFPPNTIFIFTANSTRLLEKRFLSRCHLVNFGTEGISKDLADYLARVRFLETGKHNGIDFKALADQSEGNVRDALHRLEVELMADGIPEETPPCHPERSEEPLAVSEVPKSVPGSPRNVRRCPAKGKGRIRYIRPSEVKDFGPDWQRRGKTSAGKIVMVRVG